MTDTERSAKASQVAVAKSADRMEASVDRQLESANRRTELAADRTVLAAERTYAAWVRTGLAALASGVGARAALDGAVASWLILPTGSVLVLFSAFCFAAAVWRELTVTATPPQPIAHRLPASLLIAVNGFLMLVSLAALIGIWTG